MPTTDNSNDIAIVGMAGRFPGARSVGALWDLVKGGETALKVRSVEDAVAAGVPAHLAADLNYVNLNVTIEDVEAFDAAFFDIGPRDAAIMDPQHRHFLECAWEALEEAGHVPQKFDGAIGVYAGSGMNSYMLNNLVTNPELIDSLGMFLVRHTANDKDFLSTGVSYRLNLKGPSLNVQTACSTSLVAIHLASQALLNGECDMALAGGVTIEVPHGHGYLYREGEILSPDGICRAFDAQSAGTVLTSGVGIVVLRRLADALADGDHIHAVIKASAINNDGSGKVGYLAPSVDGHAAVVSEALALAGVSPESIQYVEAHGTGTAMGDPIEVAALTRAFREGTERAGFVRLGSIKPTIGHLDTAAGVASVIKTATALREKTLPPISGFTAPNPLIGIEQTPFVLSGDAHEWPRGAEPRRAGVSSLGVGGTNAHVILEEAPEASNTDAVSDGGQQLLVLSAKSGEALDRASASLADFLVGHPEANLADVAYTLQQGRAEFAHRRAVVCSSRSEGAELLRAGDPKRVATGQASGSQPSVVFMFPGGGAQYPNMGRELYETEPVYRAEIDVCLGLLEPELGIEIRHLLYPNEKCIEGAAERLSQPSVQLPAIFITEYALAKLWMSRGIQPTAMTGHSLGEYVAACLANVMTLRDTLAIVRLRGQLMERVPDAAMLSVGMSEAALLEMLPPELSLAAVNGPELCVVSGRTAAIACFERRMEGREVPTRRIKIVGAVHSDLLDPFLGEFGEALSKVALSKPTIPYISNVTGTWVLPEDAIDSVYWVRHLRQTVRFADGLGELLSDPNRVLLEVGPGNTLTALARQQRSTSVNTVSSLPHPQEAVSAAEYMLLALGRAWAAGVDIDWNRLHDGPRQRVSLPTYPFERARHWIEPGSGGRASTPAATPSKRPLTEWFSTPEWTLAPLRGAKPTPTVGEAILVLTDEAGTGVPLADELRKRNYSVVTATLGGPEAPFLKLSPTQYRLNPGSKQDYEQLVEQLTTDELIPARVVHTGGILGAAERAGPRIAAFRRAQERGFFSLQFLLRALGKLESSYEVVLTAVTSNTRLVDGDLEVFPDASTMGGPVKVATREFPHLKCKTLDIGLASARNRRPFTRQTSPLTGELVDQIVDEVMLSSEDDTVALRDGKRWVQTLRKLSVGGADGAAFPELTPGGCYLITGGFGGIASVLADECARAGGAKLVLVSRAPSATHQKRIRELEELGAEVLALQADVTDMGSMSRAVAEARAQFGKITGVIHAAGIIDDAPMEVKERDSLAAVVSPKALGALVLEQVLDLLSLDFFLLCSSTSALLGPAGQTDYVAGNAFLDAFAQHRMAKGDRHTVAVNWGMWKGIGMTAATLDATDPVSVALRVAEHPWLGNIVLETATETWFDTTVSPETHWILDEHRLADGTPVMPGAGYAEIARAAAATRLTGPLEIRDLEFLRPLVARTAQRMQVRVAETGTGLSVSIWSGESSWTQSELVERATAAVTQASSGRPEPISLARCHARSPMLPNGQAPKSSAGQNGHLRFGPRWDNVASTEVDHDRATGWLALNDSFRDEVNQFGLHPALLDVATGLGLPLIPGSGESRPLFIPLAYGRLRVFDPLPATVLCEARINPGQTSDDTASFDVTLADASGRVVVELKELILRRVVDPVSAGEIDRTPVPGARTSRSAGHLMNLGLAHGISAADGAQAFRAILSSPGAPQVVITPVAMEALADACSSDAAVTVPTAAVARPQLRTGFEAARDAVEQQLAGWWAELLGVREVGVNDDFFDLGGHSLIALRLFARIKLSYQVELGLATLFSAPTISAIAAILRGDLIADFAGPTEPGAGRKPWPCLVPIKPTGMRPPLFCVHGAKGNVLNFRELGRLLPPEQPFYGLQLQGLNGVDPFHQSIPEMAAHYVTEIRQKQPTGPYLFGGFSGGGLVALEMAKQLREAEQQVALVLLLDAPAPGYMKMRSFPWFQLRNIESVFQYGPSFLWEKVRGRYYWWNWGKGRPSGIDFNHFGSVLAGHEATDYDGFTVLLRVKTRIYPNDLGWNRWITRGIRSYPVSGAHESMWREPHVRVLADLVSRAIQESSTAR